MRHRLFAFVLCASVCGVTGWSGENPMEEAAKPAKEHSLLKETVGKWKVAYKMWLDPSKPPLEGKSRSTIKMILGGLFAEEHNVGTMMGQRFEGQGLFGFDKMKGKFVSMWSENMSTSIMMMEGTYDEATKTLSFSGDYIDPMDKKSKTMKMTIKMEGRDKSTHEFWNPGPDGKPYKAMEFVYTRMK